MITTHHTTSAGAEHTWIVDTSAAAAAAPWAARAPATLAADLAGMADYFPHWLLVGAAGRRALRCRSCLVFLVPTGGAIRCPGCGDAQPADGLLWVGHLPALARPEPAFARRRAALQAAGFAEAVAGDA